MKFSISDTLKPQLSVAVGLSFVLLMTGWLPGFRFFASPEAYLPLHTAVELLAIAVTTMVFALSWNVRQQRDPRYMLLGIGFLCVGLIDFGHMLSYQGMPHWVTESGPEKAINFWLAARYVSALTLLGIGSLSVRPRPLSTRIYYLGVSAGVVLSLLVLWSGLHLAEYLPRTFIPGEGLTDFKLGNEYLLVVLFWLAAFRLARSAQHSAEKNLAWLALAAWTLGLAELFFTLYDDVTDVHNLLGHIYKVMGYWMIYRGIFASGVQEPYAQLAELANRTQLILDATHTGTWEWHIPSGSSILNSHWASIVGYTLEELAPTTIDTWTMLTHPDDLVQAQRGLADYFAGVTTDYESEVRMRHKNGEWVWVLTRGKVTRWSEDGNPLLMSGTHQDITPRKRLEGSLQASEHFMRSLLDIMPGMVGYWDSDLRCTFANLAYLEWFGKTPEQMQGIHIQELMGPDLFAKNEPYITAALAGERQHFERTLTKADGSTGYTWAHYVPDVVNGQVRGFFVLVSDVTELKAVQVALEETNQQLEKRSIEAEAANKTKSAFLATMSHELRTPLNGILGMAQLLRMDGLNDADRHEYAQTIISSGKDLLSILNDILDAAKIESGTLALVQQPFCPIQVLEESVALFHGNAHSKGLSLDIAWHGNPEQCYLGDSQRIRQMLNNLLSNAIKFTEHGAIQMEARPLISVDNHTELEFRVRDSGIGISAEHIPQLFQPFSQADSSFTRQHGGTGLGLSIVKNLATHMGGRVGVESTPGKGSCFWFTVTLENAPDQSDILAGY